jgi:predicted RNA binding protein YcfA (HicA-like mRNA interferase family)
MRLPRDLSGDDLAKILKTYGYEQTRQTGSHMRLTTEQNGQHHITIPRHNPLRAGTLSAILSEVAAHFKMDRENLISRLF